MKLIVGLGNPGRTYAHTRHNVGFDVLDILAKRHDTKILRRQCHSLLGSYEHLAENIILAKPQTFMNNSGLAVGELARKYNLQPSDIVVIYDDMDLPPGKIRIRPQGYLADIRECNQLSNICTQMNFRELELELENKAKL